MKQAVPGDVPVVGGGMVPTYFHNKANRPAGTITISGSGASAGYINRYEIPIFASDCSTVETRNEHLLLTDFIHRFLQSKQGWISTKLRRGAAQPHVYPSDIAEIEIPLPTIEEQRRIVAVLDGAFNDIDAATANTKKNLVNTRELFDGDLKKIFTADSATWELKRLSAVASDFGRGKSRHRPRGDPKLYGAAAPFIQTGDLSNADHWLCSFTQMYSDFGIRQSKLWPKGTVCVAIVGATVGESAILNFDACFPDSVIGIVPDQEKADAEYIEYLLQFFKNVLKEKGKGTARDNINIGTFENQLMPFPDVSVQREIVVRLNRLKEAIRQISDLSQIKLSALAELKQSLLHRAFAGELVGRRELAFA